MIFKIGAPDGRDVLMGKEMRNDCTILGGHNPRQISGDCSWESDVRIDVRI
jgi:hypothetical protein